MPDHKTSLTGTRGEPLRQKVLDAAERLLRSGKLDFSMRELAGEAGVSFATPFNQFGSKAAIMHALSARRIDLMIERFAAAPREGDISRRVLRAVDIAAAVMLEAPEANRSIMSWLGTAGPHPGRVLAHSARLWAAAVGDDKVCLPEQLALAFRGTLSFWTSGELSDIELATKSGEIALIIVTAHIGPSGRQSA